MNREGNRETKLDNDRRTRTKLERLETRDWGEREILGRETLRRRAGGGRRTFYISSIAATTGARHIYTLIQDRGYANIEQSPYR